MGEIILFPSAPKVTKQESDSVEQTTEATIIQLESQRLVGSRAIEKSIEVVEELETQDPLADPSAEQDSIDFQAYLEKFYGPLPR